MASTNDYWIEQWAKKDVPWHSEAPEKALVDNFKDMPAGRVFVPLCGKTMALTWLAERGHQVIGIELSPLACREFFEDQKASYTTHRVGPFTMYVSTPDFKVAILCGDLFDLNIDILGPISAVYDRGSYVALPASLRIRYAKLLHDLILPQKSPVVYIMCAFEKPMHDAEGPPYSIAAQELKDNFGGKFAITLLDRYPHHRLAGEYTTYKLEPKFRRAAM